MITAARPRASESAHWYFPDGEPAYEVLSKSTGKMRPTTLADAKKIGLLPSVTTIIRILDKPELMNWRIEQAVLACVTCPDLPGEAIDAKIKRVLHTEKHQDQERDAAADLGTRIHAHLSYCLKSRSDMTASDLDVFINPVLAFLSDRKVVSTEQVVVGKGYAGKLDLSTQAKVGGSLGVDLGHGLPDWIDLWDFKCTRTLPENRSYKEHALQLSAYAEAIEYSIELSVVDTYNVYISTREPGQFKVFKNPPWTRTFHDGFAPLLEFWQWANSYDPSTNS